jgi:hypothetical protein
MTKPSNEPTLTDLMEKLNALSAAIEKSDERLEIYRQTSQSLVNLSFGLIASVTAVLIISLIFENYLDNLAALI